MTLGPFGFTYLDNKGLEKTMRAGPVTLKVLTNLGEKPEETNLRPIQDIIPIKSGWVRHLHWVAALAGICLIIAALALWLRKRRFKDIRAEVIEPPYIVAANEIDRLEAQGLFEKGKVKAFYFTLTEILRRYMESIRHFPAAEYTTEEIAQNIRNNEEDRKILPLLRQADLIKFADTVPTPSRKEDDLRMARSYIRETGSALERFQGDQKTQEESR
jgi:hypothetical protein